MEAPPPPNNNPHLKRMLEVGRDAGPSFAMDTQTQKARRVESEATGSYSYADRPQAPPSLFALAYHFITGAGYDVSTDPYYAEAVENQRHPGGLLTGPANLEAWHQRFRPPPVEVESIYSTPQMIQRGLFDPRAIRVRPRINPPEYIISRGLDGTMSDPYGDYKKRSGYFQ